MIEVQKSSRWEQVRELTAGLKKGILSVGVFVNAPIELVAQLCKEGTIDGGNVCRKEDLEFMADSIFRRH